MSERERFEVWAVSKGFSCITCSTTGGYYSGLTETAWEAWQGFCPNGWQCVPKEPTHNMLEASGHDVSIESVEAWQAMLSAAPKPEDV